MTGVQAWLTLAAALAAIPVGRHLGHYVRWHVAAARDEDARWTAVEPLIRTEMELALYDRAVQTMLREHRSVQRAETARALRPAGRSLDSR